MFQFPKKAQWKCEFPDPAQQRQKPEVISTIFTIIEIFQNSKCRKYDKRLWSWPSEFKSRHLSYSMMKGGFPCGSDAKESTWMQETRAPSLGWEDPLKEDMATHSSILAWRIPWTEQPGGLQSMASQRLRHDWTTNTHDEKTTFYIWNCFNATVIKVSYRRI